MTTPDYQKALGRKIAAERRRRGFPSLSWPGWWTGRWPGSPRSITACARSTALRLEALAAAAADIFARAITGTT